MQVKPNRVSRNRYFASEADQRKSKRLPIEREVRYKVVGGQKDLSGSGKTINISRRSVLFTTASVTTVAIQICARAALRSLDGSSLK
jgi:hypothetical protein